MHFSAPSVQALAAATALFATTSLALQCQTEAALNLSDLSALIQDIDNNAVNPPESDPRSVLMGANSFHSASLNTAKVCAENQFLFENTHIKLSDVGFAATVV